MRHPINKAVAVQASRATRSKHKQESGRRRAARRRGGRRHSSKLQTNLSLRFSSAVVRKAVWGLLGFLGQLALAALRAEVVEAIRPYVQSLVEVVIHML